MTRVIFVVGATATGKSALALDLAEAFGGCILNCDSLQACRRLDIGSAKPSPADRARVPHHLFDVVEPGQRFTAGDFNRRARKILAGLDGPVFAVGGSGFYIRALANGMFDVPRASAEIERAVRARMEERGLAEAFSELSARDPASAERIGPADAYRIGRALMVMDETNRTLTEVRASFRGDPLPYPISKLGLTVSREVLAERVSLRTAGMIEAGLVAETRALIAEGFGDWPALSSVGYDECRRVISGELAEDDLAAEIDQKTMALAKKQVTWFKRDPEIHWLEREGAFETARERVRSFVDPPAGSS